MPRPRDLRGKGKSMIRTISSYFRAVVSACIVLAFLSGCASYERKVVPFKMPEAYPNAMEAAGAVIASSAYDESKKAGEAFGFDILSAGVLPVQVVFDNRGAHPIEIVPKTTFLVDEENNLWPILDAGLAYDRISKKTELGKVAPEAAKSGFLAGAAGALIGAAIGIVSGHNVGDAVMKGAAIGAAAGATVGGGSALDNRDVEREIREDLKNRALETRPVTPGEIAYGFLFFPGESKKAKELRLTVKEADTGTLHPLILKFESTGKP